MADPFSKPKLKVNPSYNTFSSDFVLNFWLSDIENTTDQYFNVNNLYLNNIKNLIYTLHIIKQTMSMAIPSKTCFILYPY